MVSAVMVPGFGESHVGAPLNGQDETRSPDSHHERSQPATVSDRQDLSRGSVSQSQGGTQ